MTPFCNREESLIFIQWLNFIFLFWILKASSLTYEKTRTPTYSVNRSFSRFSAIFFLMYYLKLFLVSALHTKNEVFH